MVGTEGLSQRKTPMTPSGIETSTFRLVARCLNQLRHCVPPYTQCTEAYSLYPEKQNQFLLSPNAAFSEYLVLLQYDLEVSLFTAITPIVSFLCIILQQRYN